MLWIRFHFQGHWLLQKHLVAMRAIIQMEDFLFSGKKIRYDYLKNILVRSDIWFAVCSAVYCLQFKQQWNTPFLSLLPILFSRSNLLQFRYLLEPRYTSHELINANTCNHTHFLMVPLCSVHGKDRFLGLRCHCQENWFSLTWLNLLHS